MLGAVLALFGGAAGLYAWGYQNGDAVGAARVQTEWNSEKDKAEQEARRIRGAGIKQAEAYAIKEAALRKKHEQTYAALQSALRNKVACPASGEFGDVRVGVDAISSLFVTGAEQPAGD